MLHKAFIGIALIFGLGVALADNSSEITLFVKPETIQVNGKRAFVYDIVQPDGTWGYTGVKGHDFDAQVINKTDIPITLHWHGLIVPYQQDGVGYVTQDPIPPGGVYDYHFPLKQSGTYFMHSHTGLALQQEMSAPFIILDPNDPYKNAQNVVMLLTDFSFKTPEEINQNLLHPKTNGMSMSMNMASMSKPDLNDVNYDAYLTNYHTLQNLEMVAVKPGSTVRLRIIDASAASNFVINLGSLPGLVIAADGNMIEPVKGTSFALSEGQRLDILVTIPQATKAVYPILAAAEGTNQQTGLVLFTPGAVIPNISETLPQTTGAINPLQDTLFHALNPLPAKPIGQKIKVTLGGDMQKYRWTINGQAWPNITPITVTAGERIQMTMINQTGMGHPMHLHGHVFEVTSVNGQAIKNGPLRDTVFVPPNGKVTIIFDANDPGIWMFHCHVLYHSEDGMMTILRYPGVPMPEHLTAPAGS